MISLHQYESWIVYFEDGQHGFLSINHFHSVHSFPKDAFQLYSRRNMLYCHWFELVTVNERNGYMDYHWQYCLFWLGSSWLFFNIFSIQFPKTLIAIPILRWSLRESKWSSRVGACSIDPLRNDITGKKIRFMRHFLGN